MCKTYISYIGFNETSLLKQISSIQFNLKIDKITFKIKVEFIFKNSRLVVKMLLDTRIKK